MPTTPHPRTVSSILEDLRSKQQDHEFLMTHQGLSPGNGKFYTPDELKIVKTYSFEETSSPSYSSILYLIETNDGIKGYSMDAYGGYRSNKDEGFETFIRNIPEERNS